MTLSTIKMTATQYLQLGEDPPGVRLELVDGEIVVSPSPTPEHSRAVLELTFLLMTFVKEHDAGEVLADVDTTLDTFNVRRPDLLFFVKERDGFIGQKKLEGVPDLAVEIVSEGSEKTDNVEKFKQYAKAGIRFYWVVNPLERTFEAYALKAKRYRLTVRGADADVVNAEPFMGLEIPLKKLWWKRK